MYNVHVAQKKLVTKYVGEDVLALPTGSIVQMKAKVPGVGKLQPSILMRTNCPAHPLINLMNGEVLEIVTDDMTFKLIPEVVQVVLERVPDSLLQEKDED